MLIGQEGAVFPPLEQNLADHVRCMCDACVLEVLKCWLAVATPAHVDAVLAEPFSSTQRGGDLWLWAPMGSNSLLNRGLIRCVLLFQLTLPLLTCRDMSHSDPILHHSNFAAHLMHVLDVGKPSIKGVEYDQMAETYITNSMNKQSKYHIRVQDVFARLFSSNKHSVVWTICLCILSPACCMRQPFVPCMTSPKKTMVYALGELQLKFCPDMFTYYRWLWMSWEFSSIQSTFVAFVDHLKPKLSKYHARLLLKFHEALKMAMCPLNNTRRHLTICPVC